MSDPIAPVPATSSVTRVAMGCGLGVAIAVPMLTLLVGGAFHAARDHTGETAEAMGRIAGLVLVPVLGGCGAAGLAWMYRRWLGALVTVGVLGVVLFTVGVELAIDARAPIAFRELTDADRAPPALEDFAGQPMLVQRAIGLAFPVPTGLTYVVDDAAIAQTLAAQHEVAPHMVGWRYTGANESQQVVVMIDLESSRAPDQQAELFAGVVEGARSSLAPQGFVNVTSEPRGALDHVLRGQIQGTTRGLMMRIFAYVHADAFVIATITVGGDDPASLEPIANGARSLE